MSAYAKLANFIEKYPKRIILAWIVVLCIALPIGAQVFIQDDVLTYDITGMVDENNESVRGMKIISDSTYYKSAIQMDMIIVVESADDANVDTFATALQAKLTETYGLDSNGLPKADMGNVMPFTKDGKTICLLPVIFDKSINVGDQIDAVRGFIGDVKKDHSEITFNTYVTGSSAIGHDTEVGATTDVQRIDPFSILLVLIFIGLFFRSLVSAATPPTVIGAAYGVTLAVIFGLSQVMGIFYITSTIVLIAMLGAGCDYCIFILARYREERKHGNDHDGALRESVTWAGESITTSGIAVIIGFGSMAICSFSMIRTMGLILATGIVFALLAALTLIPAIIALTGDKIFYPTKAEQLEPDSKVMKGWYGKMARIGEKYFASSARHSIKYAVPIVIAAVLVTIPLGYVAMTHESSYDMISTMPDGEAKDGIGIITEYTDGGMIMPTYALFEVEHADTNPLYTVTQSASGPLLSWTSRGEAYFGAMSAYSEQLKQKDDNISMAISIFIYQKYVDAIREAYPTLSEKEAAALVVDSNPLLASFEVNGKGIKEIIAETPDVMMPYFYESADYMINNYLGTISSVDDNGIMYVKEYIVVKDEPMSQRSMDTITNVINETDKFMGEGGMGQTLYADSMVTGTVPGIYDVADIVNKEFKSIQVIVVILIFILLFFVMKSYITPLRAILTIVMSIVWTLGLTFLLFVEVLGIPVTFIMPIILFVICLGLGMDYDILLTTRIKENVSKGMTNDEAITEAIKKSGSVITICGIIMASAFGTMMVSTSPMLQELGFGLCFAIAVDALVVRTYIVPAVMHLLGKWNWVGPSWLKGKSKEKTE